MSVKDVVTKIEERLPKVWSEDWDNVRLIVGDPGRKVTKIAVALDATEQSVRNAVEFGCEMLVVHHPAIFRPLKRIVMPSPIAKMLDLSRCALYRKMVDDQNKVDNWKIKEVSF